MSAGSNIGPPTASSTRSTPFVVGQALDLGVEILVLGVDGHVGVRRLVAKIGADHCRTYPVGDLCGRLADGSGNAGNQHCLATLNVRRVDQRLPRNEIGNTDRRGLPHRQVGGLCREPVQRDCLRIGHDFPSFFTPNPAPLPQTSLPFHSSPPPSTTTPAKSRPGTRGSSAWNAAATFPTSLGLIADALISTRTSPLRRAGRSISTSDKTEGGPYLSKRMAFSSIHPGGQIRS